MSVDLTYDPASKLAELHIHGILRRDELSGFENEIAERITAGDHPRDGVLLPTPAGFVAADEIQIGRDWLWE